MKRSVALGLVILTALAGGLVVFSGQLGSAAKAGTTIKVCPPDGSVNFDEFSAGPAFQGISATRRIRECDPLDTSPTGPPTRVNSVTTVYGDCPEPECNFPLLIESSPACERNLSLYARYPSPDGSVRYTLGAIRGVPAAFFDGGRHIEVYTGDATVVVFGDSATRTRDGALALVGRHHGQVVGSSGVLPAPEPGALEGKLAC